jgi:hypothetical protein
MALDILVNQCYNYDMMTTKTRRTPRKDSSYVIYEMTSELGDSYIGLTRKGTVTPVKAVLERWRKHKSRARNENRKWALYVYLKTGGLDLSWSHNILAIVRGRAEAYAYERELVKMAEPTLNDQYL